MTAHNAIKISENVYWVGAIDWALRDFHGYTTSRGTTYNAYLIMGEKPILIDTVKAPFFDEMMARIKSVIDPEKIEYIISNHAEMDHSGSLVRTIEAIKPEKVFASKMGNAALQEHFQLEFPITEIKSGQEFTLGNSKFIAVETRMLHWPDSMFTFYANDGMLFSQDGFGMHLATSNLFADQNPKDIMEHEAAKYYANILLPYSNFVSRLFDSLPSLNLDIKYIAPDHGPIWNTPENIKFILDKWQMWASQRYYNKAVIIYDTMWNSTAKMAASIADGIAAKGTITKILPMSGSNRSDIITEILDAGALVVGSPTLNQQMFPTVAEILCYVKGLKPKNLVGQAFGSFGWSGEAVKLIQAELREIQVELVAESVNIKYVPTETDLISCNKMGQNIALALKQKLEG